MTHSRVVADVLLDEKFMAGVREAIAEIERGEEGVSFSQLRRKADDTPELAELMGAAHHAYCHDTGCFDGDEISQPEFRAAAIAYGDARASTEHERMCFTCKPPPHNPYILCERGRKLRTEKVTP